jgi:hypothetical protein
MLMKICKYKRSQMSSVHVIVDKDDLKECKSKWLFFHFKSRSNLQQMILHKRNHNKNKSKLNKPKPKKPKNQPLQTISTKIKYKYKKYKHINLTNNNQRTWTTNHTTKENPKTKKQTKKKMNLTFWNVKVSVVTSIVH